MKAIIPVKACSSRVNNKNFRPFFNGYSLCDILIQKLLRLLEPTDIYISSEDEQKSEIAKNWGIQFLPREEVLAYNETPITAVIEGVCAQISGEDDIMWCQVTDPLFNEHRACLDLWEKECKYQYDSMVVVYPRKGYLLDEQFQPMGFEFGDGHIISQKLPPFYELNYTLSILSRSSIHHTRYYVGETPYWYVSNSTSIDIDSEQDWEHAKVWYAYEQSKKE